MDFLLNKRNVNNTIEKPSKNNHNVCNDSTESTVHSHHFLFGLLEDSGIATSNDAHSLEFDDQIPITPPPAIVVQQHLEKTEVFQKHSVTRVGALEKSKATSSIPSLSINSSATINIHYYPEESIFWSYVIVIIAVIVQMLTHGIQLSFGVLALLLTSPPLEPPSSSLKSFKSSDKVSFKNDQLITIGKCELLFALLESMQREGMKLNNFPIIFQISMRDSKVSI